MIVLRHRFVMIACAIAGASCQLVAGVGNKSERPPPEECTTGSTRACYTGPTGTEGVGICFAGTQHCSLDRGWSACEDEQTPLVEDTWQPPDESCDGRTGNHLWRRAIGSGMDYESASLAVAPSGNLIAAIEFGQTMSIGEESFSSSGQRDVLVVELTPDGELVWHRQLGSTGDENIAEQVVAVDTAGSIYL